MANLRHFVIPAIDIKGGKVVRLYKGQFDKQTVYHDDPVELARHFDALGFKRLHIVDLDGAKEGLPANIDLIERIRKAVSCELEVGGGIRSPEAAKMLLEDLKVDYIVVGTLAVKQPDLFEEIVYRYPNRVILSIDSKGGKVAVSGWLEKSSLPPEEFAKRFEELPVWGYLYTVVEKDGTLEGIDTEPYKRIKEVVKKPVLASGGVASLEDIEKLLPIVEGVVVGRAIYEGKIKPEEL